MRPQFRLTGPHVLAVALAFLLAVVAVNAVFVTLAVRTFPGETAPKSYVQGLRHNEVLSGRARQDALGWRAAIEKVERGQDGVRILISFTAAAGAPLSGLDVAGELVRPASDVGARAFAFAPRGNGRYEARIDAPAGAWDLQVRASRREDETFEFANRIVLP
jgi:nitrogen fixation protein FixH